MGYLIDTNVLSEMRKGPRGNPGLIAWSTRVPQQEMFLSVMVLGEVRSGIERLRGRDPVQATSLDRWLGRVTDAFAGHILSVTATVADRWGRLSATGALGEVDGLISATALVHDLIVVTRNTRDFTRTNVRLLNPFQEPSPPPWQTCPRALVQGHHVRGRGRPPGGGEEGTASPQGGNHDRVRIERRSAERRGHRAGDPARGGGRGSPPTPNPRMHADLLSAPPRSPLVSRRSTAPARLLAAPPPLGLRHVGAKGPARRGGRCKTLAPDGVPATNAVLLRHGRDHRRDSGDASQVRRITRFERVLARAQVGPRSLRCCLPRLARGVALVNASARFVLG